MLAVLIRQQLQEKLPQLDRSTAWKYLEYLMLYHIYIYVPTSFVVRKYQLEIYFIVDFIFDSMTLSLDVRC